jgi:hypothetical protein
VVCWGHMSDREVGWCVYSCRGVSFGVLVWCGGEVFCGGVVWLGVVWVIV